LSELVRLTCELHRRRWFHNDLYLCHFFIDAQDTRRCPADWHGRVAMIDLHRLSRRPWLVTLSRAKDLGQLLFSSDLPGLSARDRLRFWQQYADEEKLGWLQRRSLSWMIRFKSAVYHRNERRGQPRSAEADEA